MQIKTAALIGAQLDWAVAQALKEPVEIVEMTSCDVRVGYCLHWVGHSDDFGQVYFNPSADWAQGGPILEQEEMVLYCYTSPKIGGDAGLWLAEIIGTKLKAKGKTMLISGMRCYVASKLGDEVEIPEELA